MNWRKILLVILLWNCCQADLSAQQVDKTPQWDLLQQSLSRETRRFKGQAGILVQDLQTGWTWEHQTGKSFPAASLIKLPIMAACFQAAQEGKIRLTQQVVLRSKDKVSGSGKLKELPPGSSFTVDQLMEEMITQSDNTATNLLIDLLGIDELNGYFKRQGLTGTTLSRKMMDFSQRRQGVENYTTVSDVALLLREIHEQRLINPKVSARCLDFLKRQHLHDRIPARLPKGIVVAHKTGLERGVCHDAGIVFTGKGNYLICVLTRNGKMASPAKKFIARLSRLTYQYMTMQ